MSKPSLSPNESNARQMRQLYAQLAFAQSILNDELTDELRRLDQCKPSQPSNPRNL